MEGQSVFSYSYKRKNKVKSLACGRVIKVTQDETFDPALLFQRFPVLSQSGDLCVDDVLQYELSPYPPSLFEAKYVLRKADKAQLMDAVRKHAVASETAVLQTLPTTDHYNLDGGSLIHRLKWIEGNTIALLLTHRHLSPTIYMAVPQLCSMDILETLAQKTIYSVERHTPQIKWTLQTQPNFLGKRKIFFLMI